MTAFAPFTPALRAEDRVDILIVDDFPIGLLALEALFDREEYNVVKASSGAEALGYLYDHRFAVILLDVQMPGMSGFETARIIRQIETLKDIPIIFLTAINKDEQYIHNGYELGAVDYIFKPVNPFVLKSKVKVFANLSRKNRQIESQAALLREKEEALRKANSDLEMKVRERTSELLNMNERLLEEKNNLERTNLELDNFVYIASHDLRSPLRAICSFSDIVLNGYKDKLDPAGAEYLQDMQTAALKMNKLIDDLLTLSRISRIQSPYDNVSSGELVGAALGRLEVLIRQTKAKLDIQEGLPVIYCDSIKMTEVFVNLISNAVKFSSKNPLSEPRVSVGYRDQPGFYEFYVRDNGVGIESRFHTEIFQMFKRLHTHEEFEGTGLGLYIVQRIINDHKGDIWVESEHEKGAVFFFTLPKPQPAPPK